MARIIQCECGYVARGESDEVVVADVEEHIGSAHPDLSGKISRDDLYGWVEVEE